MKHKKVLRKRPPRNKIQTTPDVKNITSSEKEVVVKKEIIDYGYKAAQKIISDVKEEIASDVWVKEEQTDFLDNVSQSILTVMLEKTHQTWRSLQKLALPWSEITLRR